MPAANIHEARHCHSMRYYYMVNDMPGLRFVERACHSAGRRAYAGGERWSMAVARDDEEMLPLQAARRLPCQLKAAASARAAYTMLGRMLPARSESAIHSFLPAQPFSGRQVVGQVVAGAEA